MNNEKIIKRAEQIQGAFDHLWEYCKSNDLFDNQDFKNYLMWVEHEVSRGVQMIKYHVSEE